MYGLELILIIFATLAQSLFSASKATSVVGVIIFWRVLMGIGIGGDSSPGSREAEGEGSEGFYVAQSGRCPDLLVIWGGGLCKLVLAKGRPGRVAGVCFVLLLVWTSLIAITTKPYCNTLRNHRASIAFSTSQRDLFWRRELCSQNGLLFIYPAHHGSW
jgi:hypothetical protein